MVSNALLKSKARTITYWLLDSKSVIVVVSCYLLSNKNHVNNKFADLLGHFSDFSMHVDFFFQFSLIFNFTQ